MNKHHVVLDLGEKNIKTMLLKKSEGRWLVQECHIGKSSGIKEGNIFDGEKLKDCIKKYVYEVETSSRVYSDEISFIFSLENIVNIESIYKILNVNNIVSHSHLEEEFVKNNLINKVYTSFKLDNIIKVSNPIGIRCENLVIDQQIVLCSDSIIGFFNSIFEDRPRTSLISFANALSTDTTICDIGYNSTRIRTRNNMIIIRRGSKDLLIKLGELMNCSPELMEKRICISYLTNEKIIIVDECRNFFQQLFDEIFHSIYIDLYKYPRMMLAGLGCFIPFLCDFLSEWYEEKYNRKIDISLVKPEISVDCDFNKNSFFFCNEMKKNI